VNDFDLTGAAPAIPAAPPLSDLTIAFAVLLYFAIAVLILGLAVQTLRLLSGNRDQIAEAVHIDRGVGSMAGRIFRAGTDVLLLRTTFFADRWAWIFGAAFHFGLLLILIRHLRYFLDPSWVGPLWQVVVLEQPFGFYGGLLLPLGAGAWWIRQMMVSHGRILAGWPDHAVMALLVAIPLVGYANLLVHPDIIAMKAFMIGLITLHWQPLPADPIMLVHLWLVAALMVVLPFSRVLLLLPLGRMLRLTDLGSPPGTRRARLLRTVTPTLVVLLLAPVAVAAHLGMTKGFYQPRANLVGLVSDHRMDDPTVMIANHPRFLFSYRTGFVHHGIQTPGDNLERCVTCHVVKDTAGQPVSADSPKFFCRACHDKAAVSIDCFECHNSRPVPSGAAAYESAPQIQGVARRAVQ
jgi:nitrate reductase gamma subunit